MRPGPVFLTSGFFFSSALVPSPGTPHATLLLAFIQWEASL
jgi:hypothetical protein